MKSTPVIATVFACFNRRDIAVECVQRLRAQTRQPDFVVVADNHSNDGTADALSALNWDQLTVLDTGANLGNAGGVEAAMEHAFATGADAVWILDDDSWPRPEALENLAMEWQPEVVRVPLQIDPGRSNFTWPLQVQNENGGWRLAKNRAELPAGNFIATRNNWTGALVSQTVRKRIGPVMGALFIRGEDEEYPKRMEAAGVPQEVAVRAVLDHPGPAHVEHIRCFGKNFFFEPGLADWKLYYKIRNMVWLTRREKGRAQAFALALAYGLAAIRFDGWARLRVVVAAARDGWRGNLGKWRGH
ncbi:MAG: glycosyltransferase [Verrucomicrobiota bacterium]